MPKDDSPLWYAFLPLVLLANVAALMRLYQVSNWQTVLAAVLFQIWIFIN